MEKKVNKLGLEKMIAVLAIAFACECMWGCSDDVTFEWDKSRGNAKIVGFIDDSLVMVGDYRFWHETTEGWNGDYREDEGVGNPRLCVYNYRVQEDGPRWCDSLSELNSPGWFSGQLTDSVIWGGDVAGKLKIWKVGGNPHEIGITKSMDNCTKEFRITSVKQWLDGMFIAKNENSLKSNGQNCQYAILDTVAKSLTYKRLDRNLKWIENCDDVRVWGNDVYCVWKNENQTGFYLSVNERKKDSIFVDEVSNITGLWSSFEFEFMGNLIYFGRNINSIDFYNQKIIIYPNVKATSTYNFIDEKNNNVNYEK